jgi:NAD-dependent deacetylase
VKKQELIDRLFRAGRVTVMTGSGVSAASGIPTFRGAEGLRKNFRAEELASPEGFAKDPRMVWEWYDWRRGLIAAAEPNRAHRILARWARRFPGFKLVTQNVDGLHERAGSPEVIRLHGSIWELRCWKDCGAPPWDDKRASLSPLPPLCPRCGGLARPGVVWFGEMLPREPLMAAARATQCEVFLALGTSSVVQPAAGFIFEAMARGAFAAEINLEETPASDSVHLSLRGDLQEVLEDLETSLPGGTGPAED